METLKHECGIAFVRLLKPLEYYQKKYGTWRYGLSKLYLLMEKQHNRGQEGAGLACVKLSAEPGEEFIHREREAGNSCIKGVFQKIEDKIAQYSEEEQKDVDFIEHHLPYAGELYMGHLRYSTTGKQGLRYVHPFLRRSNWRAKNLCICANFNMTNAEEIFETIAKTGQHPRMLSDTYILLEQLGHRLDRESERCFNIAKSKGLEDLDITNFIENNINIANVLKKSAPVWDGGYVVLGVTGSGEAFTMRDPWGIRPAFWYKDEEILVVASERPVIQTTLNVGIDNIKELEPGKALIVHKSGDIDIEEIIPEKNIQACSFERVYFSRGSDANIYTERKTLGKQLVNQVLDAVDGDLEHTVFSYIPNTAETAYYGLMEGFEEYLDKLKAKKIQNLLNDLSLSEIEKKNKIENILKQKIRKEKIAWKDIKMRTFITDTNARKNLAAHVYDVTYGVVQPNIDNLVVIDDSIVRGTTLRESIIKILDRLSPKKIVIVSSSPQVRYPDFYGIDMSNMDEFIAFKAAIQLLKDKHREDVIHNVYKDCSIQVKLPKEKQSECVRRIYENLSYQEISDKMAEMLCPKDVKAEIKIVYQTLEGLHLACPNSQGDWYFSGHYPTPGGVARVNQSFINFYKRNYC